MRTGRVEHWAKVRTSMIKKALFRDRIPEQGF
jgi:hypothetical protein